MVLYCAPIAKIGSSGERWLYPKTLLPVFVCAKASTASAIMPKAIKK